MKKEKIVGYGELLLRLTPSIHSQLIDQASSLNLSFAGCESNIISSLSNLGHDTNMITSLPDNALGKSANRFLKSFGVSTDDVIFINGRIGTYFIEHGASIRASKIIYDRLNSCFSKEKIDDKLWDKVFNNASYYVISGITPSLSKQCEDNILKSIRIAKSNKVKILFDLNFRRNLWNKKEASSFILKIINDIDILIGNVGSISDIFGYKYKPSNNFSELKKITKDACEFISKDFSFDLIGLTIRNQINATQNQVGGLIKINNNYFIGKSFKLDIIDRLGGGDAFSAGIIHGLINGYDPGKIIGFSNSCFAITQTIKGDVNYFNEEDIFEFGSNNYSGHIKR